MSALRVFFFETAVEVLGDLFDVDDEAGVTYYQFVSVPQRQEIFCRRFDLAKFVCWMMLHKAINWVNVF